MHSLITGIGVEEDSMGVSGFKEGFCLKKEDSKQMKLSLHMAGFFYKCRDPCPYRQFSFVRSTHFFCTVPPRKHFPNNRFSLIRVTPYQNVWCPCKNATDDTGTDRRTYKNNSPYVIALDGFWTEINFT